MSTKSGGADRDRTDDFLLAKQALSQTELQPLLLKPEFQNGGPEWDRTTDPRLIKTML